MSSVPSTVQPIAPRRSAFVRRRAAAKVQSGPLRLPVYPGLGIAGALIGSWLAVAAIPSDPHAAGALRVPSLILAAGLVLAPAFAFLRNPRSLFRIEHILSLSPIYWLLLDTIQGTYHLYGVSREAIEGCFLLIGVFIAACWAGAAFFRFPLPRLIRKAASVELSTRVIFGLIVVLFGLAMLKFAIPARFDLGLMIDALSRPRWSTPWARGSLGGFNAFLDHLAYFGFVLPCLVVLLVHKVRYTDPRLWISSGLTLFLLFFLAQEGGRRIIGVVLGAALIYWILLRPRLSTSAFLRFALSAGLLLALFQFMVTYRTVGFGAAFTDDARVRKVEGIHVDDNFLRLGQIIDIFPERVPFVYEKQIVFTLVRPIPRVFWPGKPTDPGYDFSSLVGEYGVSLTSSCLGEFYASFGVLAIILGGLLYGALARFFAPLLTRLANPERLLVYSFAALVLFAGVRSTIELVLMSYGLIAWIVALILFRGYFRST